VGGFPIFSPQFDTEVFASLELRAQWGKSGVKRGPHPEGCRSCWASKEVNLPLL